jgi:hypothetical protein
MSSPLLLLLPKVQEKNVADAEDVAAGDREKER